MSRKDAVTRPCDGLTALWFPEPGHAGAATTRHAIRECCRCPEMDGCLGAALRLPVRTPGVMGGHTPRELDVLRAAGVSALVPA